MYKTVLFACLLLVALTAVVEAQQGLVVGMPGQGQGQGQTQMYVPNPRFMPQQRFGGLGFNMNDLLMMQLFDFGFF